MPRMSPQKGRTNQTITDDAALVVTVRSEAAGARVGATEGVRIKHGSNSTLPPPCCIQMPKKRSEGTPKHVWKLHGKINLKQKLLPTALHTISIGRQDVKTVIYKSPGRMYFKYPTV